MHFRPPADSEGFRAEVRAFLAEHVTAELRERVHRTGTVHDWGFHRALAKKGWIGAGWPVEYGGQGRDPWQMRVFYDECVRADAPTDGLSMTLMVANTLRVVGTEEQKRRILPRVLAGEIVICLGYSEPQAGSDVAAARLRAEREGDRWRLNGEKVFTSMAHEAQYVFLLARTTEGPRKHKGLTMFLVPTNSAGFRVEPMWTLGAPGRTNRTYYDDVRVPDAARVGQVDEGWNVITVALGFERGGMLAAVRPLEEALAWARAPRPDGSRPIDEPLVRERLARVTLENEVARLLSHRNTWLATQGKAGGIEAAMAKLFASESVQRSCGDLLDLLGPDGVLDESSPAAPRGGAIEYAFRKAAVARIYGGTSEIMRSIIAERGLGLPRTRRSSH